MQKQLVPLCFLRVLCVAVFSVEQGWSTLAITARLLLQYVSRPGERFFAGVRLHARACVCTQRL